MNDGMSMPAVLRRAEAWRNHPSSGLAHAKLAVTEPTGISRSSTAREGSTGSPKSVQLASSSWRQIRRRAGRSGLKTGPLRPSRCACRYSSDIRGVSQRPAIGVHCWKSHPGVLETLRGWSMTGLTPGALTVARYCYVGAGHSEATPTSPRRPMGACPKTSGAMTRFH